MTNYEILIMVFFGSVNMHNCLSFVFSTSAFQVLCGEDLLLLITEAAKCSDHELYLAAGESSHEDVMANICTPLTMSLGLF